MALCPLCHENFDNADDPGFVFFPIDIPFFIKWEIRDKERRIMPTAQGYMEHHSGPSDEHLQFLACLGSRHSHDPEDSASAPFTAVQPTANRSCHQPQAT